MLNCKRLIMSKPTLSARAALSAVMATSLLLAVPDIAQANVIVSDPYNNGSYLALPTLVPGAPSANAHRAVLYNHGGAGPVQEGGDLQKVAETLATAGFIAYSKKRSGSSIPDTLGEVQNGLAELMNLSSTQLQGHSIISGTNDPGVSLIGYSRGALMSLRVAELQEDGNGASRQIDKVVLMASAPGAGSWTVGGAPTANLFTTADTYLSDGSIIPSDNIGLIDSTSTEFFMIAAGNDQPPDNAFNSLVDLMDTANTRMVTRNGTTVSSTLKVYDDWMSPSTGHNLFMKVADGGQDLVNEPGYYWYDVVKFLKNEPIDTTYTVLIPEPNGAALFFLGAAGLTCCRQRCRPL